MRPHILLLPFLVALVACKNEPPIVRDAPEGTETAPTLTVPTYEYRVGPGDVLRVNVFGHPELSSPVLEGATPGSPVDGTGAVMLPLIGSVAVGELTVGEVAAAVRGRLERYLREPRVDVAVARFGAHRIFVLGEVRVPGSYVLQRPTSALEALSFAEGLGPYANRNQVAWVRGGLSQENLTLFDAGEIDPVAAQQVSPGDLIFVGRRRWSDEAEAAREILPLLTLFTQPLSLAIQAATLEKID